MKKQIRIIAVLLGVILLLFPGSAMADAASGGEYNYQDVDYYVIVDAPDGYVNLRYGPGMEYGIDEPIYNGEILHITATMDNYYDDLTWGQTDYYGEYGWVSLSQTSYFDPEPQPETTSEEPSPAVESDYLISDAYYQEDNSYVYTIPMINMGSSDIQTLNQNIYNELYPDIQRALSDEAPAEELISSTYTWNRNGDILSLIIYKSYAGPWHEYKVYNISISGQALLNNTAVIGAAGYTEEEYSQMAASAMEQSFNDNNPNPPSPDDEQSTAYFNQAFADTISSANISKAMPFINGSGDLSIIAEIAICFSQNGTSWKELDLINPYVTDETHNFYTRINGVSGGTSLQTVPGTGGTAILTINNGQKVFVTEATDNADDGAVWYATAYNGEKGWIKKSETSSN